MCRQARNKMLMVSLSMAAAGILACMAAVYDSLVPRGSLVAFLATMFPLALLVAGIVVSFVWLCEHFETSSQRRDDAGCRRGGRSFPRPASGGGIFSSRSSVAAMSRNFRNRRPVTIVISTEFAGLDGRRKPQPQRRLWPDTGTANELLRSAGAVSRYFPIDKEQNPWT